MMARDASDVLGSPQLVGLTVNPRGLSKGKTLGGSGIYAGLAGALISSFAAMRAGKQQAKIAAESQTPAFKRIALLSLTADDLALVTLVKVKGQKGLQAQDVIARVPRRDVASTELGGGGIYSPPLTITFHNGDRWELETPRPFKKQAQELVHAFGG
jgi:hypothetical protein